jgi:hypothetical protein
LIEWCSDANYRRLLGPLKRAKPEIWQRCLATAKAKLVRVLAENNRGATCHYDDSPTAQPWQARLSVIEAVKLTPRVRNGRLLFLSEG